MTDQCMFCLNYEYDEEYGEEVCVIDMDEDEFYRLQQHPEHGCPFYRVDNEYKIVEKQN